METKHIKTIETMTTEELELQRRIASILSSYFHTHGITRTEIANTIGSNRGDVSQMLNGKRRIGQKIAVKLATEYNLSIPFLMSGIGNLENTITGNETDSELDTIAGDAILTRQIAELTEEIDKLRKENETLKASLDMIINRWHADIARYTNEQPNQ